MKLYCKCPGCSRKTPFSKRYPSRMDIENDCGSLVNYTCKYCDSDETIHVNSIFAEKAGGRVLIGAIVLYSFFFMIAISFLNFFVLLFGFAALPIILEIGNGTFEKKKTNIFNSVKVSESRIYTPKTIKKLR